MGIYTFFKSLKNIYNNTFKIKDETFDFIKKVIPEKFEIKYDGNEEYTTPAKLLEDEYFNSLIEKKQVGGDSSIISESEIINNYKTELAESDKKHILKNTYNKSNGKRILQNGGSKFTINNENITFKKVRRRKYN